MKYINKKISVIAIFMGLLLFAACDDLPDEQFVKYVLFARNGLVEHEFEYTDNTDLHKDLSVSVSGTSVLTNNISVSIAVDTDTLSEYNLTNFYDEEENYLLLLPEDCYSFDQGQTGTIEKGDEYGLIPLTIYGDKVDKYHDYVLPLRVIEASDYLVSPSESSVLMLAVKFKNAHSGTYVYAGTLGGESRNGNLNLRVLDQNRCFFFLDFSGEGSNVFPPVIFMFNDDKTITLSSREGDATNIQMLPINAAGEETNYFTEDLEKSTKTIYITFSYYDEVEEKTVIFDGTLIMAIGDEGTTEDTDTTEE